MKLIKVASKTETFARALTKAVMEKLNAGETKISWWLEDVRERLPDFFREDPKNIWSDLIVEKFHVVVVDGEKPSTTIKAYVHKSQMQ